MGSSRCLLFFYSLFLSLATLTISNDPYFQYKCNQANGNYTANSPYQTNLNSIISQFSSLKQFNYGFFNLSAGENPDKVNSISLCRGDINQNQCNSCLNNTATELERFCPSNKEATAWSELCLVRYANRDMYGVLENDPRTCVYNTANVSNPDQFNQTLSELLNTLSNKAAAGGPLRKYAAGNATAGNLQTVYAMVQCTPDMDEKNCTTCLNFAMSELRSCCYGKMGCRILRPTCVLRFESNPFYNQTAVPLPSPPRPPSSSPTAVPLPSPLQPPSPSPTAVPLPSPPRQPPPSPSPTTSSSPTPSVGNGNNTTPTVITIIASIVGVLILLSSPYAFL